MIQYAIIIEEIICREKEIEFCKKIHAKYVLNEDLFYQIKTIQKGESSKTS